MNTLLFFIAARNLRFIKTIVVDATKSFKPGIYEFTLNAAAGGRGCQSGYKNTYGGNGAEVKARLKFTHRTNVTFTIGKMPIGDCRISNLGGYPNGGVSGEDLNFKGNDASGGGGGMTAISIDGNFILIAGGGAGGAGNFNGSHGGGFGYTLRVTGLASKQEEERTVQYIRKDSRHGGKGKSWIKTPGSGGGGGWRGGMGGKGGPKNNTKVCGYGGTSGYLNSSQYFFTIPTAIDGRYTNNDGDGSVNIVLVNVLDTVPENNRKPRKIFVASSMYMSFAATNLL